MMRIIKILGVALAAVLLALRAAAADPDGSARRLTEGERAALEEALTENLPASGVGFAVRVGAAAVVLNRLESPDYPDTVRGVTAGLISEGAFGERGRGAPGRDLFERILRLSEQLSEQLSERIPSKGPGSHKGADGALLRRLSRDAVCAAEAGFDPTDGALSFRIASPPGGWDFRFDDSREDREAERIRRELAGFPLVIGCAGFR